MNSRDSDVQLKGEGEMELATAQGTKPKVIGPQDAKEGFLGSIGVRFMIDGDETDQGFSLVEHPMSPRALAAPLHIHTREDEYSYVLEGRMGALLGDEVVEAGPGDLVFKPRNQWHTFWNAGDEPCRILEIIAPAGFEKFFAELDAMGGAINADPDELAALGERYGHYFKLESVPELLERFNLVVGERLYGGWTPAG
jgi:mannose-6-phosphate isomerase-like protein (cupin superfamily)